MVLWLKGLAVGFAAGLLTMGIASFVRGDGAPELASAAVPVPVSAPHGAAAQRAASTIARVEGAVAEEAAPVPAPGFLDPPPSREELPVQFGRAGRAGELAAINSARAALVAKNPNAALAELDRYERTYPNQSFGLPAQLLRIEALAVSGRPRAAKELAFAFVAAHPESPHAARLGAFVAE